LVQSHHSISAAVQELGAAALFELARDSHREAQLLALAAVRGLTIRQQHP
jgi:hypothetical protein